MEGILQNYYHCHVTMVQKIRHKGLCHVQTDVSPHLWNLLPRACGQENEIKYGLNNKTGIDTL